MTKKTKTTAPTLKCEGAAGRKKDKSKRDLHERQFIIYKNERNCDFRAFCKKLKSF